MKVLLHYESLTSPVPGGIWWQGPNENLLCYYIDRRLEKFGKSQMYGISPSADIDAYWDYLDKRMPYGQTWVLEELDDTTTPQDFLRSRRRESREART